MSELPPSDSYSSLVSFDYLYGMWSFLFSKAFIVFPKQDKDRLIFLAYYKPYPYTLDLLTFSLPAKSTKLNFESLFSCYFLTSRYTVNMTCDLDEASFMHVYRIFFDSFPTFKTSYISC